MKPHRTWIVLTNASAIRIAVNDGPGKGVYGQSATGVAAPPMPELSDAPGMTAASVGPNRGGISDPDLKGQAMAAFANDIIRFLEVSLRANQFQRLILVAPPAMLGVLRKKLSGPLHEVLHADMPKDLTQSSLDDLPAHLAEIMVV
ncbi:MAG: host attachment protein [Pseudomonadota bacterium]